MAIAHPVTRFDFDRDVRTLEAMATRLTPYVYENELYGLMPGDLAKLTVGGFLMRLNRLTVIVDQLTAKQQATVRAAQAKAEELRTKWTVAYEGKITREFQARLTALNQFLSECAESPETCSDNYSSSVEKRVIAQVLADEAAHLNILTDEMKSGLAVVDNKMRRYSEAGEFIWAEQLRTAYPQDKYWFLYVK